MDHHSIAQIDTYMGGSARIVGALKEDKIAGTSLGSGNCGALTTPAFSGQSSEIESGSTVIHCIGNKAGAIEATGTVAAPYIWRS